jgi:hypothetical protein
MPLIYVPYAKHRNNTPQGSQWTITVPDEHACFFASGQHGWLRDAVGWGLHFLNNVPDYLGIAIDRQRRLFVAKFVAGNEPVEWHGYPADPEKNVQDIPREDILKMWQEADVLSAAKIRKILRGQPCRL